MDLYEIYLNEFGLIEKDKKPLENMLISDLHISKQLENILMEELGIKTFGELLEIPAQKIYEIIKNNKRDICYFGEFPQKYVNLIAHEAYKFGKTLKNQYDNLDLPPEIVMTKINDLDIPQGIKNLLEKAGIMTLGELLTYEYSHIVRTKGFGEYKLKLLRDYVHELGYTLLNEKLSNNERKSELKEQKIKNLEEEGIPEKICKLLYKNNIFTLDELKNYGPNVYKIWGMASYKSELEEIMKKLNIQFSLPNVNSESLDNQITEDYIQQIKIENDSIKERVAKKEALIEQYTKLMDEKKELLKREKTLDMKIDLLAHVINLQGGSHAKK